MLQNQITNVVINITDILQKAQRNTSNVGNRIALSFSHVMIIEPLSKIV
jgi:hypothetical protein